MFSHKKSLCFLRVENKILTILYTGTILITGEANIELPFMLLHAAIVVYMVNSN